MSDREKPPVTAGILVYASRAALGIIGSATLVMAGFVIGRIIGYPMTDHALGDAALSVGCLAAIVWLGCALFARVADRKRGL